MLLVDVVDELLCERDVALQHLFAVGNLLQVEILAQSHKPLSLSAQFGAHGSLLRPYLSHLYACADSTSGIYHLLSVERERVAEMRTCEVLHIREVAVHEQRVAVIACAEAGIDVRQPLALGRFHTLAGHFDTRLLRLQCRVVLLYEVKELADVHRPCVLGIGHRGHGHGKCHSRKSFLQHIYMIISCIFPCAKLRLFDL